MQPNAGPGERQHQAAALRERQRVQGGVEEGRVDPEFAHGDVLRERDLGEHLLSCAPQRPQALEGGSVLEAPLGERVVRRREVDRLGAGRGPGGVGRYAGTSFRVAQYAGGVQGPRVDRGVVGLGLRA